MTTQTTKPSFLQIVQTQRRMQRILVASGHPVSIAVADKIEATLNGYEGIKYTAQEAGRKEYAYVIAKHQLKAEAELKAKGMNAASDEGHDHE